MKRGKFIKNTLLSSTGIGFLTVVYSWKIEPFWLEFVNVQMPVQHLPENLIGKTVMQISHIHVGNRCDCQYIIDSFEKAKLLNPDFVLYPGDYISYENETQLEQLKEVMEFAVKGNLGTAGI
jgi:predicted MPP superfamily phosphohydrolase